MKEKKDVRWQQRFSNYNKALAQLEKFIEHGELNIFEKQGLIKAFEYIHNPNWFSVLETNLIVIYRQLTTMKFRKPLHCRYTYELAWKTLQDLLKDKGYLNIAGPKPVIEQAFMDGYITDGKEWARMHASRNLTSHTYNEEVSNEIVSDILNSYFHLFLELSNKLNAQSGNKEKLF